MKPSNQSHPSQIDADALPDTMVQPLAEQEIGDEDFILGEVRRADHGGNRQSSEAEAPAINEGSKKQRGKKQREQRAVDDSEKDAADATGIRTDNGL